MRMLLWTWLSRSSLAFAVIAGGLAFALAACGRSESSASGSHTITLYNGQHPQLTAALVSAFEKQTGIKVQVRTGNWVGVALRVAALVYDPSLISPDKLPAKLLDLAQPQWKGKLSFAPTDSDFVPIVGAVIANHGTSTAENWLSGLKTNSSLYEDNETVAAAVNRGSEAVGIIDQYYWYRLRLEIGAAGMHSKLYFFPNHDEGAIENIAGAC